MHARGEAIVRVCFGERAQDADLADLGDRERWLLYRSMVRSRIFKTVESAFPRTRTRLSNPSFDALVSSWLAAEGPKTRFLWQVPLGFAAHVEPHLPDAPADLHDLFRFERECWHVRHRPLPESPQADAFAFDRAPLLHPSVELVSLAHSVHLVDEGEPERRETRLCIYRGTKQTAEVLALTPIAHAILEGFRAGEQTVAETVQAVAKARDVAIDERFVEKLGSLIADLIERGVILGARP